MRDKKYCMDRLNDKLTEYMDYLKHGGKSLTEAHIKYGADSDVYKNTLKVLCEYRATLKRQVARRAIVCLELGLTVNDLAMECVFDYTRELERGALNE